jgi:hypothetical protein
LEINTDLRMSDDGAYFGGSSLQTTNEVRRLQARTWKELLDRYISTPAVLPYTRQQFMAMSIDARNRAKDCPFISPVSYAYEEAGPRGNAHAQSLMLAFLDLDEDPNPENYAVVKDLAADPQAIAEHLHGLNFAVWTTAKSTPEKPRLKVVVPIAQPCPPSELPRIVRYIGQRLGLPPTFKGITESSTPAQGQYRPAKLQNEAFTAVLCSRANGAPLDPACIPPDDDGEDFFGDRDYTNPQEPSLTDDLRGMPVVGIDTVDDIRDAFNHMDPDCSRRDWLNVCSGLQNQFGRDKEQAHEAYDLFLEWSSRGTKFRGNGDVFRLWRSLKPFPEGRQPVTLRTVFRFAQEGGWDGGKVAKREKESISSWITAAEDADDLMRTGPARIAAMAVRNEVVEASLIIAIQKQIKKLTGDLVDRRAIYKEVSRERKRDRSTKKDDAPSMPNWLRPFCYVAADREFYDFGTGLGLCPASFDDYFSKDLMPADAADKPPNGKPLAMPSAFALNEIMIPRVYEKMYCPLHGGEDPFFEWEGRLYLNTYNPLSVPVPEPDHAEEAGRLLQKMVAQFAVEPEYQELLLDFLAVPVQFPGRKVPWSPCIQSAEGVGKNLLGEIMAAVLGEVNVRVISPEVQRSQWNDWCVGSLFNILNEIHHPGEMREKTMNLLKPLISDPVITVNKRNTTARCRVPNFANYIGFTNYKDALHLKESSRRWFVLHSPNQTEAQVRALNASGHFEEVSRLKNELARGLRWWLLKRKLAKDFPWQGPPPLTKYALEVIEMSKNPVQDSIEDMLTQGSPFYAPDLVSEDHLADAMGRDVKDRGAKVAHYLTVLGFERVPGGREERHGKRTVLWIHRDKWSDMLGTPEEMLNWRVAQNDDLL